MSEPMADAELMRDLEEITRECESEDVMDAKRFDVELRRESQFISAGMVENGEGAYVKHSDYAQLAEINETLLAALRAVEWRGGDGLAGCPSCNRFRMRADNNHAPDCQLHAALKAAEGQE